MELRHIRYFVAVAEALSFTKGAEKLRIAQPSLTRQIKDLEEELKVRLLDRSKKHVRLTKQGEAFLVGAKRLLNYSSEIVQSVHELDEQPAAINIGYVANPFHAALPETLALFEKEFPDTSINLFGMPASDQVRSLKERKIDIGFIGLLERQDHPDLRVDVIARYPVAALVPKKHRLARRKSIKLKDLERLPFIGLSDACYHGYGRWLTAICQEAGFKPRVRQLAADESVLVQAVRSQLGIAILPEQIRKVPHENLTVRPISPRIEIESHVAWKDDNPSPILKTYLNILQQFDKRDNKKKNTADRPGS